MDNFERMLLQLSITNYALIDRLDWEPGEGFNVITGETGAGKSILLGALGLILGERAENTKKKCIIEGKFKGEESRFKGWFRSKDLDYNPDIILRREIGAEGKSRSFINDTPVTLQVLRELGDQLVDIHSQHETLFLNRSGFQADLVDLVALNAKILDSYSKKYHQWRKDLSDLKEREEAMERQLREKDFLQFQAEELGSIPLDTLSQEALESELKLQENADAIQESLAEADMLLDHESEGILQRLRRLRKTLGALEKNEPDLIRQMDRAYSELEDLKERLLQAGEKAIPDPGKKEQLEKLLDRIYHLQQKHRVRTLEDLIQIRGTFQEKLRETDGNSDAIMELKRKTTETEKELCTLALNLTKNRRKAIPALQDQVKKILSDLAMPHAELRIELSPLKEPGPRGMDEVRFLFSANRGQDPKELNKVASGGELSRMMLAMKAITATHTQMPTIIFDEIDSGISGSVAGKMASILEKMGKNMQVVAITHLPQVAGKGTTHFKVFKEIKGGVTHTQMRALSHDERVKEIAQMLSSVKPTENAIRTAHELLSHS